LLKLQQGSFLWWLNAFERGLHPHEASGEGGNRFLVTITSSQKTWVIIDVVGSHLSKRESCFWVGPWVWIWVRV